MSRLLAATRTDVVLQMRNYLYAISLGFASTMAGALVWLSSPALLHRTVPMAVLLIVGGSTLLYVVAMVMLEREDGTLEAVAVSPLRPAEYLSAKTISLTAIAVFEGLILIGGTVAWLGGTAPAVASSLLLLVGLVTLGALHTLVGVIIAVRYHRIVEAIIPMGLIASVFQLPALYYIGAISSPLILAIPSAPPAMFIRGAFVPLSGWEWIYSLVGTSVSIYVAAIWANRAFIFYIIHKEKTL